MYDQAIVWIVSAAVVVTLAAKLLINHLPKPRLGSVSEQWIVEHRATDVDDHDR